MLCTSYGIFMIYVVKNELASHTSNLCEAIKYAYSYMRNNYPNGCKISES